jgi:hypothetical protein
MKFAARDDSRPLVSGLPIVLLAEKILRLYLCEAVVSLTADGREGSLTNPTLSSAPDQGSRIGWR